MFPNHVHFAFLSARLLAIPCSSASRNSCPPPSAGPPDSFGSVSLGPCAAVFAARSRQRVRAGMQRDGKIDGHSRSAACAPESLAEILFQFQDAFVAGQGRTNQSTDSASSHGSGRANSSSWRTASSIRTFCRLNKRHSSHILDGRCRSAAFCVAERTHQIGSRRTPPELSEALRRHQMSSNEVFGTDNTHKC